MAGQAKIGIIMGSLSDWPTMKCAADVLDELGVGYEAKVVSAHRTPKRLYEYAETAKARGLEVIIAGAGGAAHLPGMTAAITHLPVLGVPIPREALSALAAGRVPGNLTDLVRRRVSVDLPRRYDAPVAGIT